MTETKLSTHTLHALYLRDKNLVDEVMGQMTFTDAMFYHIMGVAPRQVNAQFWMQCSLH